MRKSRRLSSRNRHCVKVSIRRRGRRWVAAVDCIGTSLYGLDRETINWDTGTNWSNGKR